MKKSNNLPKRPSRSRKFQLRLSEQEHKLLTEQARTLGLSISEYIRLLIYQQAQKLQR